MKYDEVKGGERWVILSDLKQDNPGVLKVLEVEMRLRKDHGEQLRDENGTLLFELDGKTAKYAAQDYFPTLLATDAQNRKVCLSAWQRDVANLITEWGSNSENWKGFYIVLEKKGNRWEIVPSFNQHVEEAIGK